MSTAAHTRPTGPAHQPRYRRVWGQNCRDAVVRLREAEPATTAQVWTVAAVLGGPIALAMALDSFLLGNGVRDPGLLRISSVLPLLGVIAVLAARRALPGLRHCFTLALTGRVLRRGITLVLFALAMLVSWNQLALLTGVAPLHRIDVEAGFPFPGRLAIYVGLALIQEAAWRGILLPTFRARYGWLRASVMVGLVWGLVSPLTWTFGIGHGILYVLATIGWSVMVATVLEDMVGGHVLGSMPFAWGIGVSQFLLLGEETGVPGAFVIIAVSALVGGAAAAYVYGRARVRGGRDAYV